jgi:purine-binding chemotaxis protein CheW
MIMVLDFAKLIAQEFTKIAALVRPQPGASPGRCLTAWADADDEEKASDELQLVSFDRRRAGIRD